MRGTDAPPSQEEMEREQVLRALARIRARRHAELMNRPYSDAIPAISRFVDFPLGMILLAGFFSLYPAIVVYQDVISVGKPKDLLMARVSTGLCVALVLAAVLGTVGALVATLRAAPRARGSPG